MIVEDEEILRETYQFILSSQPYICDVAENGKVALEMVKENTYDLILLDIMMPVMNGIKFIEEVSELDDVQSKIVVMSNLSSGKEIEQIHALGIQKNIVTSDISPGQLVSLVRLQLAT